jgi:hypothetical protein
MELQLEPRLAPDYFAYACSVAAAAGLRLYVETTEGASL